MKEVSLVGVKALQLGVGWETSEANLDLDSIVAVFDKWGNHVETIDGLSRTMSRCGSICHHGDDVTGGKDGDAETIGVNLTTLEKRTDVLVLVVTIMRGNFQKVNNIHARIVCEVPDPDATFGTGQHLEPEDEILKFERTCKLPEENPMNINMMIRIKRSHGGRWIAQTMGVLRLSRGSQDVVAQVQEQLLDFFPKLKIPGKDMGLRTVTDVMNRLDVRTIHKLENEFVKGGGGGDGLSLYEFCECMIKHLDLLSGKEDKLHVVSLLREMFNQVDVDGDGTMEWEEFTAFVIQNGLMATQGNEQKSDTTEIQFIQDKFEDKTVHGKEIRIIEYFAALNHIIVASEKSDHVKMFDHNSQYVRTLRVPEDPRRLTKIVVLDTEYCHEENVLAVSASDFSISLWDMRKGRLGKNEPKILRTLKAPTSQISMVWSPKHSILWTAGVNKEITAWNVKTQAVLGKMEAHKDMIMHVICIDELDIVASAGLDKMIYLYGIPEMAEFGSCQGHRKGVRRICYGHNMLFSCGFEYQVRGWEIDLNEAGRRFADGNQVLSLTGHDVMLLDVQCVPGEMPVVVSCDVNGNYKVWDVGTFALFSGEGILLQEFSPGKSLKIPVRCFFLSSKCTSGPIPGSESNPEPLKALCSLVAGADKIVRFSMVSLQSKSVVTPKLVIYNVSNLQFFSASGPDVHLWDASHGGKVHSFWDIFKDSKYICSMTFDNRERKFIAGSEDGRVRVFNSVSGETMKQGCPHKGEVTNVIYGKESRCIVSTSVDGRLCILDENVEEELDTIRSVKRAHSRGIYCSAYCEPYAMIATGSSDGTLRVWEFAQLKLHCECVGHAAQICAVTFVVPYKVLVSIDCAGVILGWKLPFQKKAPGDQGIIHPTLSFLFAGVPNVTSFTHFNWHDFADPHREISAGNKHRRVAAVSDDQGYVTEFDLTEVIERVDATVVEQFPIDDPKYTHSLRFDAYKFRSPRLSKEDVEKVLAAVPVVTLSPLRRFKAHSDAIQYLMFVHEPPMLATAAFDDKIRLFSEAIGDDDDPLGEMSLKPVASDDTVDPEWLVPLETNNLGERHRQEAQNFLNEAEQEEHRHLVEETKEAQRKIKVMEALQRFQDLGLIKPRVYSDEDVTGIVSKLKGQLAVFDDFDDDSNEKVTRLRAMLEQVQEGEEALLNITWGEFFETMANSDKCAKAFSNASLMAGSLQGIFGGDELSKLEMIRKRGMHKIYEFFPPSGGDAKDLTMMPNVHDTQSKDAPLLGYLNLRKELQKRGPLTDKTSVSEKQLARALRMAKPSRFLLEQLGPKQKRKSKPFLSKSLVNDNLSRGSSFFSSKMQQSSVDAGSSGEGSFFLTTGAQFNHESDRFTASLPQLHGPQGARECDTKPVSVKKANRYGSTISEIMARANEILEEPDEVPVVRTKLKKKRSSVFENTRERKLSNEDIRERKSSFSPGKRGSVMKGQWRIRHYQKQDVMEVIHSFQKLDEDLTGSIDINEFLRLPQFQGMDKGMIDHLFRTIDSDGGGSVTQEELLRVMFPKASDGDIKLMLEESFKERYKQKEGKKKASVLTSAQRKEIETIFDMYDTDNSNSVSLVELLEALGQKLQGILSPQEISDIFASADTDKNEDLDRDEFCSLYEEYFLAPVELAEGHHEEGKF